MRTYTKIKNSWMGAVLVLATSGGLASAETIEFPDEDLATETVVPVFDKVRSVLNRNVQTSSRIELGLAPGIALNEPFYNPVNFGVNLTYHFNEEHAFNLSGTLFVTGLSQYGQQLKNGDGLVVGKEFDPSLAPMPKWMLLGNYQFTAYYGKISLSKQSIMNLTLFGLAGVGVYQTGSLSNMAIDVGFGQNYYLTPQLSARLDIKLVSYYGPDPTSKDLDTSLSAPAPNDFTKTWIFQTYLSLGMAYLF